MPLPSIVETRGWLLPQAGAVARGVLDVEKGGGLAGAGTDVRGLNDGSRELDGAGEPVPESVLREIMPAKKRVRFPREARLLRHADFERVYKQGRRHFSASMTVFYWARPQAENANSMPEKSRTGGSTPSGMRVGFTVGRVLGGAVQRNRMKRRLREAVRLSRTAPGPAVDVVINPKKNLLTADFADVLNEVMRAFTVIEKNLANKSTTAAERRAITKAPREAGS